MKIGTADTMVTVSLESIYLAIASQGILSGVPLAAARKAMRAVADDDGAWKALELAMGPMLEVAQDAIAATRDLPEGSPSIGQA